MADELRVMHVATRTIEITVLPEDGRCAVSTEVHVFTSAEKLRAWVMTRPRAEDWSAGVIGVDPDPVRDDRPEPEAIPTGQAPVLVLEMNNGRIGEAG